MVFSSTVFLFVFLPMMLILYYICPTPFRNLLLLLASLIFYGWGEPKYIVIMGFSILLNYACGVLIDRYRLNNEQILMKALLIVSIAINVGVLGFFKYADFIIESINSTFMTSIDFIKLALPIGISFYTFQAMSYVIDVYRDKVKAQKSLIDFGTYLTLFPQLIAGPIVRYITIEDQLKNRKVTTEQVSYGIRRFIVGLGKKVILANQIGLIWDQISVMPTDTLPVITAWIGALSFSFQIYFDFSGYSDMAIGLGNMFGFNFEENFNYPYLAKNITDFWRRWHISLGTWFREYIYIPLGGNKKGLLRQIINILIVWSLTGFWHGASWNFVIWGLYFGLILILEKLFFLSILKKMPKFVSRVYALLLIVYGWVIFSITDIGQMLSYTKAMFGANIFADSQTIYFLYTNAILFIILIAASTNIPKEMALKVLQNFEAKPIIYLTLKNVFYIFVMVVSVAFLVSDTYNPFLYFRF